MTTIVAVHGGGSTARFWDRLVPFLDGDGRRVVAVDLPGRGAHPADLATVTVDDEVASVLADVRLASTDADDDGPVVLVAHSSGGLVVPGVVAGLVDRTGRPRVRHVVLIAALVPPEGGDGLDCMQPRHADGLRSVVASLGPGDAPITLPGPPEDPEPFRTATGGEPLDDATLAFVVDPVRAVPDTVHHYFQPVHYSTLASAEAVDPGGARGAVPVTYLLTAADRPIPAPLQWEMVGRLPDDVPVQVVEIHTGHLAPVTHPAVVATHVLAAVQQTLS